MTVFITKFITHICSTKLLKILVISMIDVLVKRTNTKVDDEILAKVKEYLKD